jgi:hypothetical protein
MKRACWLVPVTALSVAAFAWAAAGSRLYVNGQVASQDVRVIDGRNYVPVGDLAKALGMTVVSRADGIELTNAGGAGQIANRNVGRIGEDVFTGKWRFTVLKVETTKKHVPEFGEVHPWTIAEAGEGEDLVVVHCRLKNGTPKTDVLVISANYDGINTALTDDQENTYRALQDIDVRLTETSPGGVKLLPGSAVNFDLVFKVRTGCRPRDLVFTAMRYEDRAPFDQPKHPPTDIRVKLSE